MPPDAGSDVGRECVGAGPFTDRGDSAVVRLPGRRFPGVLIQGDSLPIPPQRRRRSGGAFNRGDEAREIVGLLPADPGVLLARHSSDAVLRGACMSVRWNGLPADGVRAGMQGTGGGIFALSLPFAGQRMLVVFVAASVPSVPRPMPLRAGAEAFERTPGDREPRRSGMRAVLARGGLPPTRGRAY
ncbi:DUF6959 family protein [Streptomyces sp. NBC_00316]|uniref:DUF6959 family protein n=1 Tax=Streptomyces sp. NBC_00316 TaxID=2975710 RepID=UPI003FA6A8A0